MFDLSKKPLRKAVDQINLKPEGDVLAEEAARLAAGDYLTKRTGNPLVRGLARPFSRFSISETSSSRSIPRNFSLSTLGDYVCNLADTRLIGAAHGRIDNILLTVPPNGTPPVDPLDERHITTLMSLMDSHTRFTLLCHQNQISTIEQWLASLGLSPGRASICLSVFEYSIWAQDAYVNLVDASGEIVLCEGVNFPRYDDMSIADDIAAQSDCRALQSYLYFQGGNVLAAKDFALIGTDYVKKNLGRAHLESESKIIDRMTQLFGMPTISLGRSAPIPRAHRANADGSVVYLSGLYQPLFHIDMYVTPTGVIGASGKEICMVGRPAKARAILNEAPGQYDFDVYFEEAERQLSQHFEIAQLPLYPTKTTIRGKDRHYHLTYNNAVLENYRDSAGSSRRVVYMPTFAGDADDYGFPRAPREALDREAEAIWRSVGFEVRRMDGLEDLAVGWGSVHCITKELGRTEYA